MFETCAEQVGEVKRITSLCIHDKLNYVKTLIVVYIY